MQIAIIIKVLATNIEAYQKKSEANLYSKQ
jgi:hypothetical protein